ncbi:MAG: hypothetical protein ACJ8HJ_10210 [Massilia sp.]
MADSDIARTFAQVQYALRDRHRPLRLILDQSIDAGKEPLLPQRAIGSEAICGGFNVQIAKTSINLTRRFPSPAATASMDIAGNASPIRAAPLRR